MSWSPLYSTHFGTNTTNTKIPHLESAPVRTKIPDPKPLKVPTEFSKRKKPPGNSNYQRNRSGSHHRQTRHQANLIPPMTENAANIEARANLISPMTENREHLKQEMR